MAMPRSLTETLLPPVWQSPIITSFRNPPHFDFADFYAALKRRGFVIYPGKVSTADCFRIGNIGAVVPDDMRALLEAIASTRGTG